MNTELLEMARKAVPPGQEIQTEGEYLEVVALAHKNLTDHPKPVIEGWKDGRIVYRDPNSRQVVDDYAKLAWRIMLFEQTHEIGIELYEKAQLARKKKIDPEKISDSNLHPHESEYDPTTTYRAGL